VSSRVVVPGDMKEAQRHYTAKKQAADHTHRDVQRRLPPDDPTARERRNSWDIGRLLYGGTNHTTAWHEEY